MCSQQAADRQLALVGLFVGQSSCWPLTKVAEVMLLAQPHLETQGSESCSCQADADTACQSLRGYMIVAKGPSRNSRQADLRQHDAAWLRVVIAP